MNELLITAVPLLAPAILLLYASLCLLRPNKGLDLINKSGSSVGVIGVVISLLSTAIVFDYGTFQSGLLGIQGLGFSIRLDSLSIVMFVMISILGFVILKFSTNYLEGDPRKMVFFSRLAVTIASVELLVLSGNLFQIFICWIITSVCLHYLLVFYRNRPQAIAAARKKFIVARLGDISLFVAIGLIYTTLGTGDLSLIFAEINKIGTLNEELHFATILLVITAILKSAQFPTHGWLIEVVETPTPVSALLHAGLLNAGPFLMVRLGFLMIQSVPASLLLIAIGGFTAMFASVVYLTQPSVKVSLGYSSVAHMGFSLLLCGLGVYAAAILHVVAHSFYKAHSFLSSGSVVDHVRSSKVGLSPRLGNIWRIGASILLVVVVYAAFLYLWGIDRERDFGLSAAGAIIVMGLSQYMAATLDIKWNNRVAIVMAGRCLMVVCSFFILESAARLLLHSQVPAVSEPGLAIKLSVGFLLASYILILFIQSAAFLFSDTAIGYKYGIHLRNGLYVNVVFDRIIGSLKHENFKWANLTVQEERDIDRPASASYREKEISITK